MKLKGKTILIISPQKWENFLISKHYYALELASLGNQVYFLTCGNKNNGKINICNSQFENLKLIEFNLLLSKKVRFHFRSLFDLLVKIQVSRLLKRIQNIDIVWSFDPILFKNLNWFNAKFKIFHPVDIVQSNIQEKIAASSDVIFSVAQNILDQFKHLSIPSKFINHGLAPYYSKLKMKPYELKSQLSFAYIGNISINGIDHSALLEIINKFPKIQFDFYGMIKNEIGVSQESIDFVEALKLKSNVALKGIVHPKDLALLLKKYDGFLLCYNPLKEGNSGSNSHKLLEYLSIGTVIVSSKVSTYMGQQDLILMSQKQDNSDYVDLFTKAVNEIELYNEQKLIAKRRSLALDNTYKKQIERIELYISELSRQSNVLN